MSTRGSVVAVAALALLAAGCGGGGSGSAAPPTTGASGAQTAALAFARCMRAHGLPNWPDPSSGGVFDKSKLRRTGYSVSQVRAVQDGPCKNLVPSSAPSPAPAITPADRSDYLKAAACMRSHGYAAFPDPTFQNNTVQANVPSSIDQDSPAFKRVAATCTKLIPAGLPYSSNRAP
ncbi:MAG TPA: hypothetical protein VGF66_01540 [Gaiellaceae bacterium]|jgi:hypothetical protein